MSIHHLRIENEWTFLQWLALANPDLISCVRRLSKPDDVVFHLVLTQVSFASSPPDLQTVQAHALSIHFPRFFPAVPLEVFLQRPVFHPNVHPENGFVCLWDKFSPGDSTLNALIRLQRVLAWELHNNEEQHVMQLEALTWSSKLPIPLEYNRLHIPAELERESGCRWSLPEPRRTRLSEMADE